MTISLEHKFKGTFFGQARQDMFAVQCIHYSFQALMPTCVLFLSPQVFDKFQAKLED